MTGFTVLFRIAVIVFIVEGIIMLGFFLFGPLPHNIIAVVDAVILVALSSPMIFFIAIKPYVDARTKELRNSEARFKNLAETASDRFWEMDENFRFKSIVDPGNKKFFILPRNVIGRTRWEIAGANPEQDEKWGRHLKDHLDHRPYSNFEFTVTDDNGQHHISVNGQPIFDDSGSFQGYHGSAIEISERKQAEQILRETKAQLDIAIESFTDGFVLFDANDRFVFANDAFLDCHPTLRETQLPGMTFEEIVRKVAAIGFYGKVTGDFETCVRTRLEYFRSGRPFEYCMEDGRWYEMKEYKTRDGGIALVRSDITERREMEKELLLNEQLLEATGRTANVGGWELDVETQAVRWTKQLFHIHEVPEGQQPETFEQAVQFFPEGDRERVISSVSHAIETGEPYDIEVRLITAKGRQLWTRAICLPTLENGKVVSLQGTFQDITEQKLITVELENARQEAEKANQAKSEFLASMSHELRTPLNAVLGFGQMMQFSPNDPLSPGQNEHVENILEGGKLLLELVNQILDLASVEADQLDLSLIDLEANDVVYNCVDLVAPLGKARSIKIIDNFSSGPSVLLFTDRTRLKQILINLLSNAVKFNKDGGTVSVEGKEIDYGYLRLSVSDTGIGIAKKDQLSVFELFHRVDADPMLAREGAGIGLTVTKLLIERLAGRIGFESKAGIGSTFWIDLPLASNDDVLIWTDAIKIGVDTIDKDHQVLVSMLNRLSRRSTNEANTDVDVDVIIGELIDYTQYHFSREEAIMEVCGFPGFERHCDLHRKLIDDVKQRLKAWRNDRNQESLNLLRKFLKDWLFNHILNEDTKIAISAKGKDRGIRQKLEDLRLNIQPARHGKGN